MEAVHELDLQLAEKITDVTADTAFGEYCLSLRHLGELRTRLDLQNKITENGEQLITYLSLTLPEPESNIQLQNSRELFC